MVRSPFFPIFPWPKWYGHAIFTFFPGLGRHVHHRAGAIGELGAGGEAGGQAEVDQLPG